MTGKQNSIARSMMTYHHQMRYFSAFGKNTEEVVIGVPKETFPNERRVALSPEAAQRLVKLGFKVNIESGAGANADFDDSAYTKVGANIVQREEAIKSDLVLKVRPPSDEEAQALNDESGLISFLYPA